MRNCADGSECCSKPKLVLSVQKTVHAELESALEIFSVTEGRLSVTPIRVGAHVFGPMSYSVSYVSSKAHCALL